jgi:hypothetical protein
MRWQAVGWRTVLVVAVLAAAFAGPSVPAAYGQAGGANNQAGVVVDAEGVLSTKVVTDWGGRLMSERIAAAKAALAPEVSRPSKMRKISLNRLEKAIEKNNGALTDEMRYLAGLYRVRNVFFYPKTGDIVITGRADGWAADPVGRVVGITSGRPVVQLQDLAVALRAFPPSGQGTRLIGCSIDPTEEGLAELQRFLRSVGSYATPAQTPFIVNGLQTSLGMQTVSVDGIPADTHFAQVMVEADYRMKLIGIGREQPPVQMASFVDRASPAAISRNALIRWYFMPDYNCVRVSKDSLAMELVGDGVKLVGEDELVTSGGGRQSVAASNAASQAFVTGFTAKYSELAERSPVYAELRNLIDLAIAAAFIQEQDYYGKSGWTMELLGNEQALSVRTYNAPRQVASAVNAIWKGHRLMTPIGGGVHIEPEMALRPENRLPDENENVAALHSEIEPELAAGQWWWD